MRQMFFITAVATLLVGGCNSPATDATTATVDNTAADTGGSPIDDSTTQGDGNRFALNGQNTKIEFVGDHVDKSKPPQKGGFRELTGYIAIDSDSISSIHVEIETASLQTQVDKLTSHLKSVDFFDVRQHPKASFISSSITAANEGEVTVKGDLTLMGVTKEISFPATVDVSDGLASLQSSFEIDRTEFGMDFGLENVEKLVAMTVTVGN